MFNNRNKIEELTALNAKLVVKKQKIQDRQNEENSRIETKIRELENLAFRNKQIADGKVASIEREIEKNTKVMSLEADFYNKQIKGEEKEVSKKGVTRK